MLQTSRTESFERVRTADPTWLDQRLETREKSLRGRVIAFGGRALEKDVPAKYLNSPETPLFHKGATLYNIASARAAAHKGDPLIAVEGYIDVIAMVAAM